MILHYSKMTFETSNTLAAAYHMNKQGTVVWKIMKSKVIIFNFYEIEKVRQCILAYAIFVFIRLIDELLW